MLYAIRIIWPIYELPTKSFSLDAARKMRTYLLAQLSVVYCTLGK